MYSGNFENKLTYTAGIFFGHMIFSDAFFFKKKWDLPLVGFKHISPHSTLRKQIFLAVFDFKLFLNCPTSAKDEKNVQ